MSTQDHADPSRPWWATADPEVDRLDPDEDPLETTIAARHRAAERRDDPGVEDPAPTSDRGASGDPKAEHDPGAPTDAEGTEVCGVCPLCAGWRYLREHQPEVASHLAAAGRHLSDAHPDVADHLAAAGRHLAAALREVLDDRGEAAGGDGTASGGSSRPSTGTPPRSGHRDTFERIDLDDGQGQV